MSRLLSIQAPLDINQIAKILPHRFPFLLIDKITELSDTHIVGVKNVTMNEWFFQGHFPDNPVMPGVLQIEAMAQTGAVLALSYEEAAGKLVFLAGVDDARFRKPVLPGDVLTFQLELTALKRMIGKTSGKILNAEGQICCEANLTFAIVPPPAE